MGLSQLFQPDSDSHGTKGLVYTRRYPSLLEDGTYVHFPVAKLPASSEHDIQFGDEGVEFMLMSVDEFLTVKDAWPILQERTRDYLSYNKST